MLPLPLTLSRSRPQIWPISYAGLRGRPGTNSLPPSPATKGMGRNGSLGCFGDILTQLFFAAFRYGSAKAPQYSNNNRPVTKGAELCLPYRCIKNMATWAKKTIITKLYSFHNRKPGPLGQVGNNWLCR